MAVHCSRCDLVSIDSGCPGGLRRGLPLMEAMQDSSPNTNRTAYVLALSGRNVENRELVRSLVPRMRRITNVTGGYYWWPPG